MYNSTTELLPFVTCLLVDIYKEYLKTDDPNYIVTCEPGWGTYLAIGLAICGYLCSVIFCVGICGMVANIFNLSVLRKSDTYMKGSFKLLLIILACFEFLVCLFSMFVGALFLLVLANISRGWPIMYALTVTQFLFPLARSAALNQTILIATERLLVVIFPLKSKLWLTPCRTKVYMTLVHLLTIFGNLNWLLGTNVVSNTYLGLKARNPSLEEYPYILVPSYFEKLVLPKLLTIYQLVDYVFPFTAILILNGLLYWSIYSWNKKRKSLSSTLKGDIKTAKMFSGVTIILLLCHSMAASALGTFVLMRAYYRELAFLYVLSVTVSSSVNIMFYQTKKEFREELDNQVRCCMELFFKTTVSLEGMIRNFRKSCVATRTRSPSSQPVIAPQV